MQKIDFNFDISIKDLESTLDKLSQFQEINLNETDGRRNQGLYEISRDF